MMIFIGIVNGRRGVKYYAGATKADVITQIAGYCRERWAQLPMGDAACVTKYFFENTDEFYDIVPAELVGTLTP